MKDIPIIHPLSVRSMCLFEDHRVSFGWSQNSNTVSRVIPFWGSCIMSQNYTKINPHLSGNSETLEYQDI